MAGLDLENRPWYFALIIGVVIAGLLIWAFENYLFSDIQKDIKGRTNDLQVLQGKVREGKAAEARLPQFREEAERLETELNRLLRILPTAKQTDELIKKIKSLTERGNFRLVTFQPRLSSRRTSTRSGRSTFSSRRPTTSWRYSSTVSRGSRGSSTLKR